MTQVAHDFVFDKNVVRQLTLKKRTFFLLKVNVCWFIPR
jgi:hypothetical protein